MRVIVEFANQNEGFIALLTFLLISILVPISIFAYRKISARITKGRSEEEFKESRNFRSLYNLSNFEF